jgi:hypothetical protein
MFRSKRPSQTLTYFTLRPSRTASPLWPPTTQGDTTTYMAVIPPFAGAPTAN